MHIRLLAVGARQPEWVDAAVARYVGRLPRAFRFGVTEIDAGKGAAALKERQGERVLAAVGAAESLVALDERGAVLTSTAFADKLRSWQQAGTDLAFVIGGADGLSDAVLARSQYLLSLSAMTLPHGLARVVFVEQLYRAHTLLSGHPYHRA